MNNEFDILVSDLQPTDLSACSTHDAGNLVSRNVLLVPAGQVESSNGNFILDRRGADQIIVDFKAGGVCLPVDFQHQSLGGEYSAPDGRAPAAGWIVALSYNPSLGLLGRIEWTDDETLRAVKSKQLRYMSPVVLVHKSTRRVTGLHSAALTNVPAIRGMVSIAAQRKTYGSVRRPTRTDQGAWGRWPASAPWG